MKLKATFERSAQPETATTKDHGRPDSGAKPTVSPAARNLAMAHYMDRLIDRGIISDYTQAARVLGVSQPRMTHVMALLLLAPGIQEAILLGEITIREKALRDLARVASWDEQRERLRSK